MAYSVNKQAGNMQFAFYTQLSRTLQISKYYLVEIARKQLVGTFNTQVSWATLITLDQSLQIPSKSIEAS